MEDKNSKGELDNPVQELLVVVELRTGKERSVSKKFLSQDGMAANLKLDGVS